MQKWEYKVIEGRDAPEEYDLDELGKDGWELINVVLPNAPHERIRTYLKRAISD